jgi:hypothetical protein
MKGTKMNPHIFNEENKYYPLEEGDIEPTGRIGVFKHLLSTPLDYPHCPRCHRALMADGSCPTGDYSEIRSESEPVCGFLGRFVAALRNL